MKRWKKELVLLCLEKNGEDRSLRLVNVHSCGPCQHLGGWNPAFFSKDFLGVGFSKKKKTWEIFLGIGWLGLFFRNMAKSIGVRPETFPNPKLWDGWKPLPSPSHLRPRQPLCDLDGICLTKSVMFSKTFHVLRLCCVDFLPIPRSSNKSSTSIHRCTHLRTNGDCLYVFCLHPRKSTPPALDVIDVHLVYDISRKRHLICA